MNNKRNRNRLVLLLIFLLFATPVVIAVLMHTSWWPYQPAETVNRGILVEPPSSLNHLDLSFNDGETYPYGKWVVLYPVASPCAADCQLVIENLRQIHRAKGRRQDMLVIVPLLPKGADIASVQALLDVYAAFLPALDINDAARSLLSSVGDVSLEDELIDGQAFLVDPSGNIMMRYAAGFDPGDLNKDLKRLLKWSAQDG